jgi:hypothetical protein
MVMGKVWVLDTDTKGTGAEMVPLEKVLKKPAPKFWPPFALEPPARRNQPPGPDEEPRQPLRFRIIDVMTREPLADDVDIHAAVERLRDIRSVVDVSIYVWFQDTSQWRLLTLAEQKRIWELSRQPRDVVAADSRA